MSVRHLAFARRALNGKQYLMYFKPFILAIRRSNLPHSHRCRYRPLHDHPQHCFHRKWRLACGATVMAGIWHVHSYVWRQQLYRCVYINVDINDDINYSWSIKWCVGYKRCHTRFGVVRWVCRSSCVCVMWCSNSSAV